MMIGTTRFIEGTRTRFAAFARNDALRTAMILFASVTTIAILVVFAQDWPAPIDYLGLE